jgi:muramoyltetrapeptide carboxypeptidase
MLLKKYNIPVVYNFPGHIRDNRALVMGSIVHLDVSAEKVF